MRSTPNETFAGHSTALGQTEHDWVAAPEPGTRIGRYWLTQLVGKGGMGRVYAAYDPELDRIVALKLLRSEGPGAAEHRIRLSREAQALARLSHPNVVPVFDVGASGPWLFIAMELVEGPDLMRWMATGPHDWREVLDVFLGAARGLAAAHAAGLVHRDFKPNNVVIDSEHRARVLDFGLVRMDDGSDASATRRSEAPDAGAVSLLAADELTAQGTVMGTPLYMAPEQHRGRTADDRSDQFSFCMSLYEALYGRRPYAGAGIALLEHKERGPIPPPRDADVPTRIWEILRRGLHADPQQRWPDMDALARALSMASRDAGRRLARPLVVTALLGGGLAVMTWVVAEPQRRCDPGATELARVWSPERAQALENSLHASSASWAPTSHGSVRAALDGFATQWSTAYINACADGSDEAALDHRMDCLRGQLDAAAALVDVLQDGGPDALEHAAFASARLPHPADCINPATSRPQDLTQSTALATAQALGWAGRHEAALEAARRVELDARARGDAGLELEASLLIATAIRTLGDRDEAGRRLREVSWAAVTIGRDELAAKAAMAMASLLTTDNALDEAETWLRHAETSLRRAPSDRLDEAELRRTRAGLLAHRGLLEEALAEHVAAASMLTADDGVDDLIVMGALADVASLQMRLGQFDAATQSLERIIAAYENRLGAHHPALAKPLSSLAGVHYGQRRFEEALTLTRRALEIDEQVYPPGHRQLTTRRSHMGLLLHELEQHDEALALAQQVYEAREKEHGPDHPEVAQALYNIGHVLLGMNDGEAAISHFERALAVWEATSGSDHHDLAYPLASVGEAYFRLGRAEQAIAPLERAFALFSSEADTPLRTSVMAVLAQALWDGGGDRARALTLAADAYHELGERGETAEAYRVALERWYARIGRVPPGLQSQGDSPLAGDRHH